ncbi:hypothetical protein MBLNU230_g7535t1 [Neophaeotheca triangularis]
MEPPTTFKFPGEPASAHSPRRSNGTRPAASTTTSSPSKESRRERSEASTGSPPRESSPSPSPSRKTNLFADYHPVSPSKASSSGFVLPQSPSMPEIHAMRGHGYTNSDVQGLVKRFEHLDVRDRDAESAERRRRHEAELRRAHIAREEAESDCRRYREELRSYRKDQDESRERERKVAKRLEAVMEEYSRHKEQHASQNSIYEKEVRKARKEAFKSSSAVLKLQEELKSTRNSLRITQSGFEANKQKVQQREQETFEAQYQLVAVQEELEKLKQTMKIVEEEAQALKTSLKEEEVARIAAEGRIALPAAPADEDELQPSPRKASPKKRSPSPLSDDKENVHALPKKHPETKALEEQLLRQKRRLQEAEEIVSFMRMECQFRCCACRTGEPHGQDYFHASGLVMEEQMARIKADMASFLSPPASVYEQEGMEIDAQPEPFQDEQQETASQVNQFSRDESTQDQQPEQEPSNIEPDPNQHMTVAEGEAASEQNRNIQQEAEEEVLQAPQQTPSHPTTSSSGEIPINDNETAIEDAPITPPQHRTSQRPHHSIRTITTTTTIPTHFNTPSHKPPPISLTNGNEQENIDPDPSAPQQQQQQQQGFDRAAALAAIQYRRGRAKSIADGHLTPRKQMMEGANLKERRDVSAPALGGKNAGVGVGYGGFGRGGGGSVGRSGRGRMG